MPYQLMPISWQPMQAIPVTGACFMPMGPKVVKFVGLWQLSHGAAPYGMCPPFAPGDGGCAGTTFAKPIPGPWHVAQLLAIPT